MIIASSRKNIYFLVCFDAKLQETLVFVVMRGKYLFVFSEEDGVTYVCVYVDLFPR